ncbi:SIR2 family protein [Spongiimicrobium sp. 2-473A-2-J]|uniref:SIR2 family protein n=1 Tax=Eudoraea algarum TaxID=3417568 RepID=UPI003D366C34
MTNQHTFETSKGNLQYLAKELALNHFDASTIDLYPEIGNEAERKRRTDGLRTEKVFLDKIDPNGDSQNIFSLTGIVQNEQDNPKYPDSSTELAKHSRNILVIGAGCSANSFENIPLAPAAIEEIKQKITIAHLPKSAKTEDDIITLDYFIKFCQHFKKNRNNKSESSKYYMELPNSPLKNERFNKHLIRQFNQEYSLLREIGEKYLASIRKWKLNQYDYKVDTKVEFETFLSILASILPMDRVRDALSETYDFQNATTLFYSIVAHLFKHRFIDVIINFNFDELLDRAILDEIGEGGFDMILSDGDCISLTQLSKNGRLRQPLYIKPHGTARHKSSLRFTKDQYHDLPPEIRKTLIDLIASNDEGLIKRINLLIVGFDMNSIEFNEILMKHLPVGSAMFFFFRNVVGNQDETNKKAHKKTDNLRRLFEENGRMPRIYLIGNEYFTKQHLGQDYSLLNGTSEPLLDYYGSLGNVFKVLYWHILEFFDAKYKPRDIHKHYLISNIFGNREFWKLLPKDKIKNSNGKEGKGTSEKLYSRTYFKSKDYYKDRVFIEILINLAINNGRIDPVILMAGNAGHYYSEYTKQFDDNKDKTKKSLLEMLQFFELENGENPNSLGIRHLKLSEDRKVPLSVYKEVFEKIYAKASKPNDFCSEFLTEYFKLCAKYNRGGCDKKTLKELFRKIVISNNSKIHSEFRNTQNHIFERYHHSDIINTNLHLDLHFTIGLMANRDVNAICVVADNGFQLAKFLPQIVEDDRDIKIYLIAEDSYKELHTYKDKKQRTIETLKLWNRDFFRQEEKLDLLEDKLRIIYLPVVDHNRHMTFFLNLQGKDLLAHEKNVTRAIYYYKKGLSSKINPIRIYEENNLKYLLEMFNTYSDKALSSYMRNKLGYQTKVPWIYDDIEDLKKMKI